MHTRRLSIIGLVLAFCACGRVDPDEARAKRFPKVPPGQGFPLRIDFVNGEACELAVAPQRVLIANTYLVDIVTRLIGAERVLALPKQALAWSRLVEVDDGFRAKASFREIDAAMVLELDPDLLLCSDTNIALGRGRFAGEKIPTLTLPQPRDFGELRLVMQLLTRVLGAESAGAALIAEFAADRAALSVQAAKRQSYSALMYSNLGGGGWSTGFDTLSDEVIRLLGMRNPVADAGRRGHVQLTLEELITFDPDVIIVQARLGESKYDSEAVLRAEPRLQGLKAIVGSRIVRLHPRLFSTGSQEILAAAREIADQVDRMLGLEWEGR